MLGSWTSSRRGTKLAPRSRAGANVPTGRRVLFDGVRLTNRLLTISEVADLLGGPPVDPLSDDRALRACAADSPRRPPMRSSSGRRRADAGRRLSTRTPPPLFTPPTVSVSSSPAYYLFPAADRPFR